MINTWVNAFIKPKETFAQEKANASWGKAIINLVVAGVVSAIFAFLAGLLSSLSALNLVGSVLGLIIGAIVTPIMYIILMLIVGLILFVFAKLLGGQGSFVSLFYLLSTYFVAYSVLAGIFSLIPIAGPILAMILALYGLFLEIRAVQEAQQLSMGRAVAAIVIPIVLITIILVVLAVIIGAAFVSMLGGLSSTGYFGLS